jgi:hypothetical protein
MVRRKLVFILLWNLVSFVTVYSQQLSHQVLVPLAGIATDSKVNFSQTAGETAVEIVGCVQYVFTQGFQQPGIKINPETPPLGTGVKVYPNPVSDHLTIELYGETARNFRIEIVNITGSIAYSDSKVFYTQYWYKEPVDVQNLLKGIYIVRIYSDDGMIRRSFKIEKL